MSAEYHSTSIQSNTTNSLFTDIFAVFLNTGSLLKVTIVTTFQIDSSGGLVFVNRTAAMS